MVPDLSEQPELANRSVTIYEVAAAAGVSPSTVSRTFGRPGRVSARTAEHVRRVAEGLGYHAKTASTYSAVSPSRLIALVVADIANPFYARIVRGAQSAAASAGYVLLLIDSQESVDLERSMLMSVYHIVDGVVLASSRMSDAAIRTVAKILPVVVLNREVTDVACVLTDNQAGIRGIVRHLAGLGHTGIAYLSGPTDSWADGTRWRELIEIAKGRGMHVSRQGPFPPTVDGGLTAAATFAPDQYTSAIAYNDQLAIGFCAGLRRRGLAVPENVSVVGFDNIPEASLVNPPLTTVAAPLNDLGARAIDSLLTQIRGSRRDSSAQTLLPTRLLIRSTTGQSPA